MIHDEKQDRQRAGGTDGLRDGNGRTAKAESQDKGENVPRSEDKEEREEKIGMKINEVVFFGFTQKELGDIRKGTSRSGNEEFDPGFTQEIADVIGVDVMTLIQPGGQISLIKAGG